MLNDACVRSPRPPRLPAAALVALLAISCSTPDSRIPNPDSKDALDALIREEMTANSIPGVAVGIVTSEGLVRGAGYGVTRQGRANDAAGGAAASRVTVDTRFPIASITKPITAFAAVRLAEQGVLDLDAPVSRYLPDFDPPNHWRAITARDLLSHHGGLVRDYQKGVEGPASNRVDIVGEASGVLLADPPGATYRYSNVGYSILGRVIAAVTGESYEEHTDGAVFGPLGMDRSLARLPSRPAPDFALGHASVGLLGNRVEAVVPAERRDVAAGAAVSTVRDLAAFVAMLLREGTASDGTQVLAPDSVAALFTPPYPQGPLDEDDYALGWKLNGLDLPWPDASHGGTLDGYSTLIALVPDHDVGVIVLANGSQPFSRYVIAREAIALWLDEPIGAPVPAPGEEPVEPPSGHFVGVGDFSLHIELDVDARRLVLSGEELSLIASRGDGPPRYRIVKRILGIPFSVAGALNAEEAHLDFAVVDDRLLPRITLDYRDLALEMFFLPLPTTGTAFATSISESTYSLAGESAPYAPLGPTRIRFTHADGFTFADLDAGGITRMVLRSVADSELSGGVFQAQGTGETFRFESSEGGGERLFYSGLWFDHEE
jgi:CubicO group peptidase (beta-lactamase class C family)